MTTKLIVRDKEFENALTAYTRKGVGKVAEQYVAEAKQLVSTPYPPASVPGESPHKRTGVGRESIGFVVTRKGGLKSFVARVGVDPKGFYMMLLEIGTRNIEPRPWVLVALKSTKFQNRAINRLKRLANRVFRRFSSLGGTVTETR